MIYTVGTAADYERYLRLWGIVKKGPGGSVWENPEEALAHCSPGQAVFGVDAAWEDASPSSEPGATWRDLSRPAVIVFPAVME